MTGRMAGKLASVVALLGGAYPVLAAIQIVEWGGHDKREYTVVQMAGDDVGVYIQANTTPALPWKFEAYDSSTGVPGNINFIYIDSGLPIAGIQLNVIPQAPRVYGALDIGYINLVTDGASTNVIQTINIAGDLATSGDIHAYGATQISAGGELGPYDLNIDGPVSGDITLSGSGTHTGSIIIAEDASAYNGDITIGGHMAGDMTFGDSVGGTFTIAGDLRGTLTIAADATADWLFSCYTLGQTAGVSIGGDLLGGIQQPYYPIASEWRGALRVAHDVASSGWMDIKCITSTGSLDVDGDWDGSLSFLSLHDGGTIDISDDVDGTICCWQVTGDLTIGGDLVGILCVGPTVGDVEGNIEIVGNLTGLFEVHNDVEDGATISIGQSCIQPNVSGTLHVLGDLDGDVHVYNGLYAPAWPAFGGHILVDGGMGSTGSIDIDGNLMGTRSSVVIDFDGYDLGDAWAGGATVSVGTPATVYTGNSPAARVYKITCQKGDMDNDGDVDADDIDPFGEALEGPDSYEYDLPGLSGSMLYHADMDCDGIIEDVDDWDAFVLRLYTPGKYYTDYPGCEACPELSRDGARDDTPVTGHEFARTLLAVTSPDRIPFFMFLCAQSADHFARTPRGEFWEEVLLTLCNEHNAR